MQWRQHDKRGLIRQEDVKKRRSELLEILKLLFQSQGHFTSNFTRQIKKKSQEAVAEVFSRRETSRITEVMETIAVHDGANDPVDQTD